MLQAQNHLGYLEKVDKQPQPGPVWSGNCIFKKKVPIFSLSLPSSLPLSLPPSLSTHQSVFSAVTDSYTSLAAPLACPPLSAVSRKFVKYSAAMLIHWMYGIPWYFHQPPAGNFI